MKHLLSVCFEANPNQTRANSDLAAAIPDRLFQHHQLREHESEQTPGDRGEQRSWPAVVHGIANSQTRPRGWAAATAITDSFHSSHWNLSAQKSHIVSL